MAPHSRLGIPRPNDLAMPLRDLMRGVQQAVRIPMALAHPFVSHLPGPLRDTLMQIGRRAEVKYNKSLTIWRPSAAEIRLAAKQPVNAKASDLAVTGRVVAWAIEVALTQEEKLTFFISESIVTLALRNAQHLHSLDMDLAERAAHSMFALVAHGFGPSTQDFTIPRMTPEHTSELRVAAFSAMLFLLAERTENDAVSEEMKILSYAITIAELIATDIHAAAEDMVAMTSLLRTHAELI